MSSGKSSPCKNNADGGAPSNNLSLPPAQSFILINFYKRRGKIIYARERRDDQAQVRPPVAIVFRGVPVHVYKLLFIIT